MKPAAYFLISNCILYLVQYILFINKASPNSVTTFQIIFSYGQLLWLAGLPMSILATYGMLIYEPPNKEDLQKVKPIKNKVCWRIVSRGENKVALIKTIREIQRLMQENPLFPYLIEVVTDSTQKYISPPNKDIVHLNVPKVYRTYNNTKYKARALHFALTHSQIESKTWIMHLDEESHPTQSCIQGICKFITEQEHLPWLQMRIGQGMILYYRNWKKHLIMTLADMGRTGMDLVYYFQFQLGLVIIGFHGSYILVRNDIEKQIGGFDFSDYGAITEDACWALIAQERGRRFQWVEGYIREQSTQSPLDYLKQRRRWFEGLLNVVLKAPLNCLSKLGIATMLILWSATSLSVIYSVINLFWGTTANPIILIAGNYSWAIFITMYLIGLDINLDEYTIDKITRIKSRLLLTVLLPFFTLLEILSALLAIFSPHKGFYVIKK